MDRTEKSLDIRPAILVERSIIRVREVQVDQWHQGLWTPIEQLCAEHFTELSLSDDELLELILAEYDLRGRLGERPMVEEYINRFPQLKDRLTSLFAMVAQLEDVEQIDGDAKSTSATSLNKTWPHDLSDQSSQVDSNQDLSETLANDQASSERAQSHSRSSAVKVPDCGMKIGKFHLVEKLGQGGMGTVFRASHSLIDHHVALKLMLPHLVGNSNLQKRFLKEAQVCVGLQHPNLVRTFDIDEDGGCLYLTMELLKGCHLAERISKLGPFNSRETANIIRQVAEGLAYAHSQGIIHRDVKPQNLMLTDDNQVKVLDLGLAKLLVNFGSEASPSDSRNSEDDWHKKLEHLSDDLVTHDGRLTYVGTILGTLGYMSREQATNPGVADVRNDIFSLGCTAYFLLTGQSIHGNQSPQEILRRLISQSQWSEFPLDGVCNQWKPVLGKILAWNADDRPASMQDVIACIDAAFDCERPWKPDPDNLTQLREKLLEFKILSDEQWDYAESKVKNFRTNTISTISWTREPESIPTPALQFLFRTAQLQFPSTGETILTQYQVQQILAGLAGTLRQGQYLIRDSLNRGWKGDVFLAWDTKSNRKVTLRMLPLDKLHGLDLQSEIATVVTRTGAHLQKLQHPNIAKILQFKNQGDWLLIASEYLPEERLREFVMHSKRNKSQLNARSLVQTAIELARGVQYLHEQGCLHLDLSPDRWAKCEKGTWRLLDAGWANLLLSKQWKDMPQSAGLPPVLPPEVMVDLANFRPTTDIYALGQVFRFLMTGEFPFRSMKLSDIERPVLPTLDRPSRSWHNARPECSSNSLNPFKSLRGRSSTITLDWKTQWTQLIDSMTRDSPYARLQTMDRVLLRLDEINELIASTRPAETDRKENVIHGDEPNDDQKQKVKPSISQRLRRLFGKDR